MALSRRARGLAGRTVGPATPKEGETEGGEGRDAKAELAETAERGRRQMTDAENLVRFKLWLRRLVLEGYKR